MYCPSCGTEAPTSARFCISCGAALVQPSSNRAAAATAPDSAPTASTPPVSAEGELPRLYAGFWRRTAAVMIDWLIISLIGTWVVTPVFPEALGAYAAFVISPSVAFYFIAFEISPLQATPGKLLMRIKVTDMHGARMSVLGTIVRTAAALLSVFTLGLGFMLAGVSARRQALHDMVTRSLVVPATQEPVATVLPPGASMRFSPALGWFAVIIAAYGFFTIGSAWRQEPKSFEELLSDIGAGGNDDPMTVGRSFKLPKQGRAVKRAPQ